MNQAREGERREREERKWSDCKMQKKENTMGWRYAVKDVHAVLVLGGVMAQGGAVPGWASSLGVSLGS